MPQKHGMTNREYRESFGLLLETPLLDEDLVLDRKRRMDLLWLDDDFATKCVQRNIDNAAAMKGKPGHSMSSAGKQSLAARRKGETKAKHAARFASVLATIGFEA